MADLQHACCVRHHARALAPGVSHGTVQLRALDETCNGRYRCRHSCTLIRSHAMTHALTYAARAAAVAATAAAVPPTGRLLRRTCQPWAGVVKRYY
jgi:hypothetical protein